MLAWKKGHAASVSEMVDFAIKEREEIKKKYSFLDIGCGNGWVAAKS